MKKILTGKPVRINLLSDHLWKPQVPGEFLIFSNQVVL